MSTELALCMNCGNVHGLLYIKDKISCRKCNRFNFTEIDENIIPIVWLLNQKGYETWACCSGHIYDTTGYIIFERHYELPELPSGFKFDTFNYDKDSIRWSSKNDNSMESLNIINGYMNSLYDYAQKLPSLVRGR